MIKNASFQRKVIYLGCIALLLVPLYMIGNPASGDPSDPASKPGGKLAQLRAEYDLSQAELGEIDPASESMKLATLGMRGVAANILWTKASQYRRKENWEELVAVIKQMAKLQPHFVSVWEFQSHNLSYNISVEHDDYRFRYQWVKKGIDFLMQGTRYNRREPTLFWTVGWYTGQKFGRSDEYRQFRKLFASDNDFHKLHGDHVAMDDANGPAGRPDNWLVSKLWFDTAYAILDTQGVILRGKSPHIFHADGPKAQINYSIAIESEGYLDEMAEFAWRRGLELWEGYGGRLFPSSWGENLRLGEKEAKLLEVKRLTDELNALLPNARERILAQRMAALTPEERGILELDFRQFENPRQYEIYEVARAKTAIDYTDLAEEAPREVRARAFRLADQLAAAEMTVDRISRYRDNVNYEYWLTRCRVEQLPQTVKARRHIYEANRKMDLVLLDEAREEFEAAWAEWAKILEQNSFLMQKLQADDLVYDVERYIELLGQLDEELSEDFPLRELLGQYGLLPGQARTIDPAPRQSKWEE